MIEFFQLALTDNGVALTGITPVLVSETSSAEHRGGFLGYVFVANCKDDPPTFYFADFFTYIF
jgi:hypothetical protein